MRGVVCKSTGSWITVRTEDGSRIQCKLKGQFRIQGLRSTNPVAIGDRIDFERLPDEDTGLITQIFERDNYTCQFCGEKVGRSLQQEFNLFELLPLPHTSGKSRDDRRTKIHIVI